MSGRSCPLEIIATDTLDNRYRIAIVLDVGGKNARKTTTTLGRGNRAARKTTTMTTDKIKIKMSERRPLSIVESEWPIIASAEWHDGGTLEFQANHRRLLRVRENQDGERRIIYGWLRAGNGGVHANWRGAEAGFLIQRTTGGLSIAAVTKADFEAETVRAIRRVAGIIEDYKMSDECIAALPEENV
jgi:hypothetical protein